MAVSRTHRYTVDQADLDELIDRRATLIAAIRSAHAGPTEARLTRLEDGTCTDVWRWDSAEQMRAALADMPRFGAQAGAAWSLTRAASHVDGEIVDERRSRSVRVAAGIPPPPRPRPPPPWPAGPPPPGRPGRA